MMKQEIIKELENMGWVIDDWNRVWDYHKQYTLDVAEEREPLQESRVIESCGFMTDVLRAIDRIDKAKGVIDK